MDALVLGDPVRLLRNVGQGEFEDVTVGSGLQDLGLARGVAWADVDADGDLDFYAGSRDGSGRLLIGDGAGGFVDATLGAGLESSGGEIEVSFLDFDGDGLPDLFRRTPSEESLYRNLGDLSFELAVLADIPALDRRESGGFPTSLSLLEQPEEATLQTLPAPEGETEGDEYPGRRSSRAVLPRPSTLRAPVSASGGPSGTSAEKLLGSVLRAHSVRDRATQAYLRASSTPTLGRHFPLSQSLLVSPSGFVGLGSTTPSAQLEVAGDMTFTDPRNGLVFPSSPANSVPMISLLKSGSSNADRMVLGHSPAFAEWGLEYRDSTDEFAFRNSLGDVVRVGLAGTAQGLGLARGAPLSAESASGVETVKLDADGSSGASLLQLRGALGEPGLELRGQGNAAFPGGSLALFDRQGDERVKLDPNGYDNNRDTIELSDWAGNVGVGLTADIGGRLQLSDGTNSARLSMSGGQASNGPGPSLFMRNGPNFGVALRGGTATQSSYLRLMDPTGQVRVDLDSSDATEPAQLHVKGATYSYGGSTYTDGVLADSEGQVFVTQGGATPTPTLALALALGNFGGYLDIRTPLIGRGAYLGAGALGGLLKLYDRDGAEAFLLDVYLGFMKLSAKGPVNLTLEADIDNSNEFDLPSITFKQDGGTVQNRIGFDDASNNFGLRNFFDDDMVFDTFANGTSDWEFRKVISGFTTVKARIDESGNLQLDGSVSSPAADLAEYYPIEGSVELGDLAAFTGNGLGLRRATSASDVHLAGVISSAPALTMGISYTDEASSAIRPPAFSEGERYLGEDPERRIDRFVLHEIEHNARAPLALAGRVPCKVSGENGPIRVGEPWRSPRLPATRAAPSALGR